MQPLRNPYQIWRSNKFPTKDFKKQFEKENADILKNYHERIRGTEELTIIEIEDTREVIEKNKKQFEKKEKEIGLDKTDLPKDEDVLELLNLMELEENAKEKEQPLPQEPIGLQPMEEVIQEVPSTTEKEIEEPLGNMEEEIPGEIYPPILNFNFPLKNVISTSTEGMAKENVIKYVKVRFIFEDEVSIVIDLDTTYTSKQYKEQGVVNGIITYVTKQRVYGNTDYHIRIWHDNKFENLQKDLIWAKNHQSFQGELVSGSKQTVYIKKKISKKWREIYFSAYVQNTIIKKQITDNVNLELLNQLYNKVLFTDMIYRRGKDIVRMIDEKTLTKGYISSEAPLLNYIRICISDPVYEIVADYISYIEDKRDDEAFKERYEELSGSDWAFEILKDIFENSEDLSPQQKIEARKLVDEYKMENLSIRQGEINALEEEINEYGSEILRRKGINYEEIKDNEEEIKKFFEEEDDNPEISQMKQNYKEYIERFEERKQIMEKEKERLNYVDQLAAQERQEEFLRKQRKDVSDLEYRIKGTTASELFRGFRVEIYTSRDGRKIGVGFKFENEEQKNKFEEIFNKKIIAITIHTDKFPPKMQPLSDQRQKELEEYFATRKKS